MIVTKFRGKQTIKLFLQFVPKERLFLERQKAFLYFKISNIFLDLASRPFRLLIPRCFIQEQKVFLALV